MQQPRRVPRPQGVTYLAIQYQQSENKEFHLDQLLAHIITTYALNGFRYQGQTLSIPEMAMMLNIPQETVMLHISQLGTSMGNLVDPSSIQETLKSIVTLSLSFSLQDRGLIQNQLELVLDSQDGHYKPFISAEVNKNLKLMLESNKNLMETYKTFFTNQNQTTNILNISNSEDLQKDYLTPDKALDLISNQTNQLGEPAKPTSEPGNIADPNVSSETKELAEELFEKHGIGDFEDLKESRSGTEALRALDYQPEGLPAKEATELESSHTNAFRRRGEPVVDVDTLPDNE